MATDKQDRTKRIKIVAQNVRFSYSSVFEPTSMDDAQKKKYHVTLLIPKDTKQGKAQIAEITNAIEELKEANKKGLFGGVYGAKFWNPLRDGDDEKADTDGYEGHMFICVKTDRKPEVRDGALKPITDPADFYSGCFGHCSFNLFPYNAGGSKGIAGGLIAVVKTKDGDAFGGGGSVEQDFADILGVETEEDNNADNSGGADWI